MIPPLNLPTDNLYKFMALLGCVLFIGGTFFPWVKAYEIETKLIELNAEIDLAGQKLSYSENIIKLGKESPISTLEILKEHSEISKHLKIIELDKSAFIFFAFFGILNMSLGSYLMYRGFKLWYYKIQKCIDHEFQKKMNNE